MEANPAMRPRGEEQGETTPTLQRIRRPRISDVVTDQILQLIGNGELRPGDKLPSEAELMRQAGVGRPSLRSALHTLEAMHIIESRQGVGAFVCEDPPIMTVESAVPKLFSRATILQAIAVRRMLEPEIAASAARVATDEGLQRLHKALRSMEESRVDSRYPEEAHVAFHLCVAEVTENTLLVQIARFLLTLWQEGLDRAFDLSPVGRGDASSLTRDHQILYDAIAGRDPSLARSRMLEHVSVTESRISLLERLGRSRITGEDDNM